MNKYSDRILRQQFDENEKVNALLNKLNESSGPMDKTEIDALVKQIAELDDKTRTVTQEDILAAQVGK